MMRRILTNTKPTENISTFNVITLQSRIKQDYHRANHLFFKKNIFSQIKNSKIKSNNKSKNKSNII